MKTAISLPDALFAYADKTAKSMGIPRSRLFAKAVEEFIKRNNKERITEQLNEVYSVIEPSEAGGFATASLESLRQLTKNDAW